MLLGAKIYFAKMSLSLHLHISHVLASQMLLGELFQTTAECLKPQDANAVDTECSKINCSGRLVSKWSTNGDVVGEDGSWKYILMYV